jgi:hypothetical protein
MGMITDLLDQAETLARLDPKKPKQANLRRALSAAYYALFHFLVEEACKQQIGVAQNIEPYRHVLARAFVHGTMKSACKSFGGGTLPAVFANTLGPVVIPRDIRSIADSFVAAQDRRHLADYDLQATFTRDAVLADIAGIKRSMDAFGHPPHTAERALFLVSLMCFKTLTDRPG